MAARGGKPEAQARVRLALEHYRAGRLEDAEEVCRELLSLEPAPADAWYVLGAISQQAGEHAVAAGQFEEAIRIGPPRAEYFNNLGISQRCLGRLPEAEQSFRRATELHGGFSEAHNNLGNVLRELGRLEAAERSFRKARSLKPDFAPAHGNLGIALRGLGRLEEAEQSLRRAIALDPAYAEAHNDLGATLFGLGRLEEAEHCYREALALDPSLTAAERNLLFLLNYAPGRAPQEVYAAHREFARRHYPAAQVRPLENLPDPERRLRVGYVSGDFGRHPVGYFMQPVLTAHDPDAVEAWCYSGRLIDDDLTVRLRAHARSWRSTIGVSDDALAAQIAADGIDILVDLSGHTGGNRLTVFGRKPAPVQVAWLGYFNTTGVSAIDYVLMDAATVPEGAERWFSETVVRLPEGRFCYAPPDYAPAVASLPARSTGRVTFGSFNNMSKVTPTVIALWAAVLRAVPDSRLMLKWKSLADAAECARLREAFGAHGIAPERLELRGRTPHVAMLAEYGEVDIGLDPFPFCGGLTSCEALWMGVPIVTLPGSRAVSRQTLAFLTQLDLAELAAPTPERYVALAAELAGDLDRLTDLRAGLRPRMAASSLCDGARFTRGLEAAYRTMWRTWCARTE